MQTATTTLPDEPTLRSSLRKLRYYAAFITVRPRRWFFRKCISEGSFGAQWLPIRREEWDNYNPRKDRPRTEWEMIVWPNIHWVLAYRTIFKFFKWLNYDAWRPLCKWDRVRKTYPWYARLVHRIGQTTAGCAISGGECWHCASEEGCPVELSNDETGKTFILERIWSSATMDGTDHRFCGKTICPKCGYEAYYEDGSL
jgi:hypothetical protein